MIIISISEKITLIGVLVSACVMVLTYLNLRELKKSRFEESRAYIVVNFVRLQQNSGWRIVIKNYGRSSGVLKSILVDPPLEFPEKERSGYGQWEVRPLTEITNLYLAPAQSLSSYFDFSGCPDQIFNLTVSYSTMGKNFIDKYQIDLTFRRNVLTLVPNNRDADASLREIAQNTSWFFERFL